VEKNNETAYSAAIIVCAGNARRMEGTDKLIAPLAGIPVAVRSIQAFNCRKEVGEIIVVCRADQTAVFQRLVDEYHLDKVTSIVTGGETRQLSVFQGVRAITNSWKLLIIHDGARPLVSQEVITQCLESALEYGAAVAAVPVKDTIKRISPDGMVSETVDRSVLYSAQTPQVFDLFFYCSAMDIALENHLDFTDDCQLAELMGSKVFLSPGSYENLKITTKEDFKLAELFLSEKEQTASPLPLDKSPDFQEDSPAPAPSYPRIGHGYDVHKLDAKRKLILGGIEVPFEKGLLGHSDADVLLHAIMDALLGAASLGDIGGLFPDDDPAFAGADSSQLLIQVGKLLDGKGFQIVNIDAVMIAQAPKLKPFIPQMRGKIAASLSLDVSQVNIKATTEEGLGFTGTKKGMAAHAVCLIDRKP
jgi:2-C-methyl-D-erythritol 2,4-cyclodiphosphate synthase/2-C-methyl-D-erythritol 4-phosphate cytidylyltransferase